MIITDYNKMPCLEILNIYEATNMYFLIEDGKITEVGRENEEEDRR